ncbi:MAG: YaeQ family protein [Pseudomonadota bacterium]|nr:YaeQ family protein [Pseudomonadota bacterium]
MALGATMYVFNVELADSDRGVYETLEIRAAQHPSEAPDYLLTRLLAYCLEYTDGIGFSKGLSDPDEPTVFVRDLTGALQLWIEIGTPDAERVHRASKAAPRVVIYCHKDAALLASKLAGEKIHRVDALELYAIDRAFLADLVRKLDRRMNFTLTVAERHLYLTVGDETLSCVVERLPVSA